MKNIPLIIILLFIGLGCSYSQNVEQDENIKGATLPCSEDGIYLQILGSGGPDGGDGRASTGYLVWVNGNPLVMIDAGGGTYLRMQQAGAHMKDLKLLGISHFHPDHASDLPAFLWTDLLSNRSMPLNVSGPSASGSDGLKGFLLAVNDMATPRDAFTRINAIDIEPRQDLPTDIYQDELMKVTAIGVNHGTKPTLAYKISFAEGSIAFGSDQTLDNPAFTEFIRDVDLVVLHFPISEQATEPFIYLHVK